VTRYRIVTALALVGLAGVGLTALMAAREPGDKAAPGAQRAAGGKGLVCLGTVDTEDKMIDIYPDNFPQPSQVTKVLVREGDDVKKGQKLLELDTELLDLKVREADSAILAAQDDLAKAEAAVRGHAVQVKALEKEWQGKRAALEAKTKELEEAKQAEKSGSKNRLDLDAAQAALREAEFNLEAARIKWEGLKAEVPNYLVDQAQHGIEYKQNLKKQAERALAQTTCTAKEDGKIIRSFVSEGSQFNPMLRQPAFWFVKKGPLLVRAEVTQEFAGRVRQGQLAVIQDESDNRPDSPQWTGKVTKVVDQFLPKRHSSGSALDIFPVNDDRVLECLVSIDPAPGQAPLRFGQKVRVKIEP
jgi:multidrug resistance efflux pump